MVNYLMDHHGYSAQRAYRLAQQHRLVQSYQSILNPRTVLRQCVRELAAVRVRYGSRRIRIQLNREGWHVSKHLAEPVYPEDGLALRRKQPLRRKMVVHVNDARYRAPQIMRGVWTSSRIS